MKSILFLIYAAVLALCCLFGDVLAGDCEGKCPMCWLSNVFVIFCYKTTNVRLKCKSMNVYSNALISLSRGLTDFDIILLHVTAPAQIDYAPFRMEPFVFISLCSCNGCRKEYHDEG
jgi:hypothetical protein